MSEFSWNLDSGASGTSQKAEFTKFPEGITRIRIIDDAPYQRWTHYLNKFKRSVNCPGKGCPICEIRKQERANKMPNTHNMTKRFAINIINRETNRVEIMEQGKTFFQDLIDIRTDLVEEKHDLKDADIKVRRRGMSKDDTSYRLDVDKVYPLSASDEQLLKDKIKLDEYFKPHTPEQIIRILNGEDWNTVMSDTKEETTATEFDPASITDEDFEIS
jgi:hypothetical protein